MINNIEITIDKGQHKEKHLFLDCKKEAENIELINSENNNNPGPFIATTISQLNQVTNSNVIEDLCGPCIETRQ